ncbi:MAG: bile acid:sodium symporter family protein [Bacteroidia bacterium]|nr:bile acid:sodium symporter family protein [Bacteroidia bacterium]
MFKNMEVLDAIRLNFSEQGLMMLNITIAFIMFGVALDIKPAQFKELIKNPKPAIVGILSQWLLLPALTFLLILAIRPSQAVALGMLLVASCPGGNISNFISSLAKANVALSVSMTAFSTLACIILTPLNFAFWGGLYAASSPLLVPIKIDPLQMIQTVAILLGLPVLLGMAFAWKYPNTTKRILKGVRLASLFIFIGFIIGSFAANYEHFLNYIGYVFIIVLLHNGLGLLGGYSFARIFKLVQNNCRTISIETGIQNSGLGLVLIFNPKIFDPSLQLGGMAFIAAWWGIWHILSGMSLAWFWNRRPLRLN